MVSRPRKQIVLQRNNGLAKRAEMIMSMIFPSVRSIFERTVPAYRDRSAIEGTTTKRHRKVSTESHYGAIAVERGRGGGLRSEDERGAERGGRTLGRIPSFETLQQTAKDVSNSHDGAAAWGWRRGPGDVLPWRRRRNGGRPHPWRDRGAPEPPRTTPRTPRPARPL